MANLLRDIDRLIRGDATRPSELYDGHIDFSVGTSAAIITICGLIAGACIGSYSVVHSGLDGLPQLIATTLKIPVLFVCTIAICFPSLFVFSALFGSRLPATAVLRLVWSNVAVISVVLASFAPIIAFFGLSGPGYSFMVLLNFVAAGTAGLLGLSFMLQTLDRVIQAHRDREASVEAALVEPSEGAPRGALSAPSQNGGSREGEETKESALALQTQGSANPPAPARPGPLAQDKPVHRNTRMVFRVWATVFGLVGAQCSWILRPLIGNPGQPFTVFREKGGSFIMGVLDALNHVW